MYSAGASSIRSVHPPLQICIRPNSAVEFWASLRHQHSTISQWQNRKFSNHQTTLYLLLCVNCYPVSHSIVLNNVHFPIFYWVMADSQTIFHINHICVIPLVWRPSISIVQSAATHSVLNHQQGGDKIHNKMDAVSHPTNRLDNYPAKRKDYKSTERVGALKFLVNTNWFYLWFVRCVSLWLWII